MLIEDQNSLAWSHLTLILGCCCYMKTTTTTKLIDCEILHIQQDDIGVHYVALYIIGLHLGMDVVMAILWRAPEAPQRTAQERGSLKGLLPVGTPTSRASLPAFCRQYCCSSEAAWDT